MTNTDSEWATAYTEAMTHLPPDGTVLRARDEMNARIDVEFVANQPPFLYGRAFIPMLFGQSTGWFLQATDTERDCQGMKCILASNAREELIKRLGLVSQPLYVKSLRILRTSKSGKAFICEVAEFADAVIPESKAAA